MKKSEMLKNLKMVDEILRNYQSDNPLEIMPFKIQRLRDTIWDALEHVPQDPLEDGFYMGTDRDCTEFLFSVSYGEAEYMVASDRKVNINKLEGLEKITFKEKT